MLQAPAVSEGVEALWASADRSVSGESGRTGPPRERRPVSLHPPVWLSPPGGAPGSFAARRPAAAASVLQMRALATPKELRVVVIAFEDDHQAHALRGAAPTGVRWDRVDRREHDVLAVRLAVQCRVLQSAAPRTYTYVRKPGVPICPADSPDERDDRRAVVPTGQSRSP